MKKFGLILAALLFICATTDNITDCTYNGKKLYGRVKVVDSFADFKVKVVDSFADLDVTVQTSFANKCGDWIFVESFPDFTIQYVDAFPDFTIKFSSR